MSEDEHIEELEEVPVADRLGRPLHDLRISVTDRCNLRCTYCMPADQFPEDHKFLPRAGLLTFEEIAQVVRAAAPLGVAKVRITGGEPLLRKNLPHLIHLIREIPGIEDIALTTNGLLLAACAKELQEAGLNRVTVSLDSLDEDVLAKMSGVRTTKATTLEGIAAAEDAGLSPIKINCVVQRGTNDHTLVALAEHFRGTGHIVRFIEYMDVGTMNQWNREEVLPSRDLLDQIHARFPVHPVAEQYAGEVATRYAYDDGEGEIGLISSVTQPFCGDCTRLRLSSDGNLFTCLFANKGMPLRDLVRGGVSEAELTAHLASLWTQREDRYSELRSGDTSDRERVEMYHIGG